MKTNITQCCAEPEAWAHEAAPLTDWASRLVNRTDVWISYLPLSTRSAKQKCITVPADGERREGALTRPVGVCHFTGADQGHLIGLHAISPQNTCRWIVIDIDRHDGDQADAEQNLRAAIHWQNKLHGLGFQPLLIDSNGNGGYHLLVVFSLPVESRIAYAFARSIVSDYAHWGLRAPPETIPKQPSLSPSCPFGSAWRLPGRHHTRDHWCRVWHGSGWLAGTNAIAAILATSGDDPALIPRGQLQVINAGTARTTSPGMTSDWARILQTGANAGTRHTTLIRVCGHYLGHGIRGAELEELAVLWNQRNSPPLGEEEVRKTVRDLHDRHARHRGESNTLTIGLPGNERRNSHSSRT